MAASADKGKLAEVVHRCMHHLLFVCKIMEIRLRHKLRRTGAYYMGITENL